MHAHAGLLWRSENAHLEFQLSMIEDRRGNYRAALAAARRALLIDKSDPMLWHHAGNMSWRNGLTDDAVIFYQGAILLAPSVLVFWARLCPVLAELGRMSAHSLTLLRALE